MSNSNGQRREIIELDEFPRSSTPEPAPKRQRTSRKASSTNINTPTERPRVTRSAGAVERAEPPRAKGSAERSSDPLQDRSATPEVDPEEAAIEDSPSGVKDSAERLDQPEDSPLMATSWMLPAVPTSTGVDTGAMPTTDLEQAAWERTRMGTPEL